MMDEMMEQQELLASRAERAAAMRAAGGEMERLRASNERLAEQVRRLSDAADDAAEDMTRVLGENRRLKADVVELRRKLGAANSRTGADERVARYLENISDQARLIVRETVGMEREKARKVTERAAVRIATLAEWLRDK